MSYKGKIDLKFKIGAEVTWFIFPFNFSFSPGIWRHQSGQEPLNEGGPRQYEFHLRRHLHCRNVAQNIWHGFCRLFYELMELPWLLHCGGMSLFFLEMPNVQMSSLLYSKNGTIVVFLSLTLRTRLFQSCRVVEWFTVFRLAVIHRDGRPIRCSYIIRLSIYPALAPPYL